MCGIHGESLSYITQTKQEMRKQRWQCLEAIQWETHSQKVCYSVTTDTYRYKQNDIFFNKINPSTSCTYIYFFPNTCKTSIVSKIQVNSYSEVAY